MDREWGVMIGGVGEREEASGGVISGVAVVIFQTSGSEAQLTFGGRWRCCWLECR